MITSFSFQRLTNADLPMLHSWLNRPHITQWWGGGISLESVQTKFQEHIHSDNVFGYIASIDGRPMAYVQAYNAATVGDGWWSDATPGTWGIDQSLANEEELGKGLGSQLVRQFSDFVFLHHGAKKIITDPVPHNGRAIRCYEKAGFEVVGPTDTPDGIAMLMVKKHSFQIP